MEFNGEFEKLFRLVERTAANVFLTGKVQLNRAGRTPLFEAQGRCPFQYKNRQSWN